jgi:hypothetical protein
VLTSFRTTFCPSVIVSVLSDPESVHVACDDGEDREEGIELHGMGRSLEVSRRGSVLKSSMESRGEEVSVRKEVLGIQVAIVGGLGDALSQFSVHA